MSNINNKQLNNNHWGPIYGTYGELVIAEEKKQIEINKIKAIEKNNFLLEKLLSSKEGKDQLPKPKKVDLFISKNGDIYRSPKQKYHYCFKEGKMRIGILEILIRDKGYVETRRLLNNLHSESEDSIRKSILSINEKVCGGLRLPEKEKLIIGKNNSGYKINPFYKIKIVS
ncbi:MAG: hypothetical protein WC428_07320 [Candidatus Paceibacterota bacterium]|jgi:hypothetical protein